MDTEDQGRERSSTVAKLDLAMRSAARQGIFVEGMPEWAWPGVLTDDAHLRKLTEEDILKSVKRAIARGLPELLVTLYGKSLGTFIETNENVAAALEQLDDLLDTQLGRK